MKVGNTTTRVAVRRGTQSNDYQDQLTDPERLLQILDRFARYKVPLQVTEFDVAIDDEQLQADYLRDFFLACFSHPSVELIQQWASGSGVHWRPQAALFRADWSAKPNGRKLLDLIHNRWKTQATGTTDADGRFTVRGFLGDYELTIAKAGRVARRTFPLRSLDKACDWCSQRIPEHRHRVNTVFSAPLHALFRYDEHLEIIVRQRLLAAELSEAAAEDVHLGKSGRLQEPTHFGRRVVALAGRDRVRLASIVRERQFGPLAEGHQVEGQRAGGRGGLVRPEKILDRMKQREQGVERRLEQFAAGRRAAQAWERMAKFFSSVSMSGNAPSQNMRAASNCPWKCG